MRYLALKEVLDLHARLMWLVGESPVVADLGSLEPVLAQSRMTFAGEELYPTVAEKAAPLGFSLICNHPFLDGNKRTGHAAMEVFLVLNGFEIAASAEEQERIIVQAAAGECPREALTEWIRRHVVPRR